MEACCRRPTLLCLSLRLLTSRTWLYNKKRMISRPGNLPRDRVNPLLIRREARVTNTVISHNRARTAILANRSGACLAPYYHRTGQDLTLTTSGKERDTGGNGTEPPSLPTVSCDYKYVL